MYCSFYRLKWVAWVIFIVPTVIKLSCKRCLGWKYYVKIFLLSVKISCLCCFCCVGPVSYFFNCAVDRNFGFFGLCWTDLWIFLDALWIQKSSLWIKKIKTKTESQEGVCKQFYQHYYDLLRQWKVIKVCLEDIITSYYQILEAFKSLLSIRQVGPDVKICWFAVTRPGLQETCGWKNCFDVHFWKKNFCLKYIINKD